jgi:hypothetical protein
MHGARPLLDRMRDGAHGTDVTARSFAIRLLLPLLLSGPAAAQGSAPPPADTPEQKRAFCQRVAAATLRCGPTTDLVALSACLVRTLPLQDSLRVAQAAAAARNDVSSLLTECGVR